MIWARRSFALIRTGQAAGAALPMNSSHHPTRKKPSRNLVRLSLRLYVAGQLPHSVEAAANLRSLCAGQFASSPVVEIVDALQEPGRALGDGIVFTPMLVRLSPGPVVKIPGTLADQVQVRSVLGL